MDNKAAMKDLSNCEKLIMKAVWDSKTDIALQELIVQLRGYGKDYARTTVVTFLKKMAEKGYVSTYRVGNASFVHAEIKEEDYRSWLMQKEADFWFGGKVSGLMSALCDGKEVSKEEIQKIRELLDGMDD